MSLMLWIGKREFMDSRMDYFETLHLQLTRSTTPTPLHEQLETWAERDKERKNPRWRVFAYAARRMTEGGKTFSQAMEPFLPNEEFLLLQAGEYNNDMAGALRLVCETITTKKSMFSSVALILFMGVTTLASVLITAILLGIFMWPEFLDLAPIRFWPAWCVPLIKFHQFVTKHWFILTVLVVLQPFLYFRLAPNWVGRSRKWADFIPPFSVYKSLQAVSLLSAMGALIQSGLPVHESFKRIKEIVPPYLRWHVTRMLNKYESSGEDSIKAIRTGLFTQAMQDRIEDAARGQSFDEVLKQVGARSTEIMQRVLSRQANVLSGVLMAINMAALCYTALVLVVGTDTAQNAAIQAEDSGTRLLKK